MIKIKKWIVDYFKKRELRNDWVIVESVTYSIQWTSRDDIKDTIYYSLFENGLRERKFEANIDACVYKDEMENYIKANDMFNKFIYPWLHGKEIAEIPTYSMVKDENLMENLRR